jgi:hypothetical protein
MMSAVPGDNNDPARRAVFMEAPAGAPGIAVAGVILVRELDERLGFDDLIITQLMTDSRRAKRMRRAEVGRSPNLLRFQASLPGIHRGRLL